MDYDKLLEEDFVNNVGKVIVNMIKRRIEFAGIDKSEENILDWNTEHEYLPQNNRHSWNFWILFKRPGLKEPNAEPRYGCSIDITSEKLHNLNVDYWTIVEKIGDEMEKYLYGTENR